ncbi:CPBP family intramembrane glutamic endopeptidase [Massilia sp. S19_KUP03_FR1]|uniref:CPBP family intramembrane glutamic endopeptidase n=1 Tax=Massilia sp. S19_KUP03_FR1 TaxID=3025503 RepID=UPI002FCD80F8
MSSLPVHRGVTRFSSVRIVLAMLAVCIPVALVLILSHQIPDRALRAFWPPLLAAALGLVGYIAYVRRIERRAVTELHGPAQGIELGAGLALGTLLFLGAVGIVALAGDFDVIGTANWRACAKAFTDMMFVALIEEILFRGVIFRLCERSQGTWLAIVISALLFGLAHLPNEGMTAFAVGNTVIAGVMFAAAYLQSRRLWLPIGLHFSWNFVSDGVLSLPTSGNAAHGLLQLRLTGPDWLTGGAYGLEGSVVTLILMTVVSAILLLRAMREGQCIKLRDAKARQT